MSDGLQDMSQSGMKFHDVIGLVMRGRAKGEEFLVGEAAF